MQLPQLHIRVVVLVWIWSLDVVFVLQWFCVCISNKPWKWKWLTCGCCFDLLSCSSRSTSCLMRRYIYALTVLMWVMCLHASAFQISLPLFLAFYLELLLANIVCVFDPVTEPPVLLTWLGFYECCAAMRSRGISAIVPPCGGWECWPWRGFCPCETPAPLHESSVYEWADPWAEC